MATVCIIFSSIAAIAAIVEMFRRKIWAPGIAWVGLLVLFFAPANVPTTGTILFWLIAGMIATGINALLPKPVADSSVGVGYIAGGALAGMFVGIVMSQAAMIIGAVAGAFIGAFAFSRTPSGMQIRFPFSKFFNYTCAKGLPAIVTVCICGITIMNIILLIQSL